MSDIQTYPFMARRMERPAVLAGGRPLVRIPDGFTVEREKSRWGVNMMLKPRPREQRALPRMADLSRRGHRGGPRTAGSCQPDGRAQVPGYHGPYEQRLERRLAREIAKHAPKDAPPVHVFAVKSGSAAEWIMYMAVLYKRLVVRRRRLAGTPEILTPAVTFEATWSKVLLALSRCVFAEVNEHGCIDVAAAEALMNELTQMICAAVLYNHGPDLDGLLGMSTRHDVDIVLDSAHGPLVRYNGIHVAYLVTALMISGQESKLITPGSEIGFLVTTNPVLASLFEMLRNVGRQPGVLPTWWSRLAADAFGDNARANEIDSILTEGSLELYLEWEPNRTDAVWGVHQGLAAHSELPWTDPPPSESGRVCSTSSSRSSSPAPPQRPQPGRGFAGRTQCAWLAAELVTEVAAYYPTPDDPSAEYHPNILGPRTADPGDRPVDVSGGSRSIVARAHLLPHELLARRGASQQIMAAMLKMHEHVDSPEIQSLQWALRRSSQFNHRCGPSTSGRATPAFTCPSVRRRCGPSLPRRAAPSGCHRRGGSTHVRKTIASAEDAFALGSSVPTTIHPRRDVPPTGEYVSEGQNDAELSRSCSRGMGATGESQLRTGSGPSVVVARPGPWSDVTAEPLLRQRFG